MNPAEVYRNWTEQKSKLKEKLAIPADNDLPFETGKKDEVLTLLQIKLGMTRDELQELIQAL